MSDISIYQEEAVLEELSSMPSETATDVDDIPDQTPEPDMDEEAE